YFTVTLHPLHTCFLIIRRPPSPALRFYTPPVSFAGSYLSAINAAYATRFYHPSPAYILLPALSFANSNENAAFGIRLKFFSEAVLCNENNPLFEEVALAFTQFMKSLKK
ncbi:DUF3861 family protein, partial [Filimonas effusa]